MALIRAFIAIELPAELKKELTELELQLKKNSPSVVKWVDPNSIHITLKFFGEISEDSVKEVLLVMEEAVESTSPFQLDISGIGAFPGMNRIQIVWLGVKGSLDKIAQLQQKIDSNAEKLGFPREAKKFTPHITLGRVRDDASINERQRLGRILGDTTFAALHNVNVTAINLMKSQLTNSGPIYTCIASVKLK